MLTSVRSLLAATAIAGATLVATPAFAEEGDSDITVSGNVAMVTDYRFRGVSFTDGKPAIQGGVDIGHSSGVYIGTWGSSLEDSATFGSMELDVYAGWSGDITPGLTLDVGLLYYMYPAKDSPSEGAGPSDYFEPYISLGTTVGPVGATLGVAYAWDQDAIGSDDNLYVYFDLEAGIPDTPITLTGHIGYTDGSLSTAADGDSFDYSIGASATVLGGLSLGVAYVGVEGPSIEDFTDDAVVGTLSYSF